MSAMHRSTEDGCCGQGEQAAVVALLEEERALALACIEMQCLLVSCLFAGARRAHGNGEQGSSCD